MRRGYADHQDGELRLGQPTRYIAVQHAAIAAAGRQTGSALARDDEHELAASGVTAQEKTLQYGVGFVLTHTVQIDARDIDAASGQLAHEAAVEERGGRRISRRPIGRRGMGRSDVQRLRPINGRRPPLGLLFWNSLGTRRRRRNAALGPERLKAVLDMRPERGAFRTRVGGAGDVALALAPAGWFG